MSRHEFFIHRMKELGIFDADGYEKWIGECVKELSQTFAEQRHSGNSAQMTRELFNQLFDEWEDPEKFMNLKMQGHENMIGG